MLKKILCVLLCASLMLVAFSGCGKKELKIGVSMGVGAAARWDNEKELMESYAKELGCSIEVRINRTDEPPQLEDCKQLIDSGIDVLLITPRNGFEFESVLTYAKEKNVPVISYSRAMDSTNYDLYVGYDSFRIGQRVGQYLIETVHEGDYILLRGDSADNNSTILYNGAMTYIEPLSDSVNIIEDTAVKGWDPAVAKEIVISAINKNNGKVDAIVAPNDTIAAACVEAVKELKLTNHVVITGMDAELSAVKRIVAGEQDMTIFMDLQVLARTAIEEAVKLGKGEKPEVNGEFKVSDKATVQSNLIGGQVVTKENIDKVLIEKNAYTKEQIYG